MDSLSHLVAGALVPIAFAHAPRRTALVVFGIIAGEFADIDVFFTQGTIKGLLTLHRGITHSLFIQPLLMLIILVPFYFLLKKHRFFTGKNLQTQTADTLSLSSKIISHCPPKKTVGMTFGVMALMALCALYLHVFLDSMTTFGTQIFLPFSASRVALPAMFIVDFLLLVPAAVLLVLALRQPPTFCPVFEKNNENQSIPPGALNGSASSQSVAFFSPKARKLARMGLCWIVLYPLASLAINFLATPVVATSMGFPSDKNQLITEPFSPFVWKLVHDNGATYSMGTVFLLSDKPVVMDDYTKADPIFLKKLAQQEDLFHDYMAFSPTMVQETTPIIGHPDMTLYTFFDLRYQPSTTTPARWIGRDDVMFSMEAIVAEDGTLKAYRFLKNNRDRNIVPWIPGTSKPLPIYTSKREG